MTFQFLCPQGHLLQGEEAHAGMECQCPQCGMAFIIPQADGGASASGAAAAVDELIATVEMEEIVPEPQPQPAAAAPPAAAVPPPSLDDAEVTPLHQAVATENLLHIPCPNGHELETPPDMVGHRARCPQCGVEFRLRREKSIEHQYQQKLIEYKRGEFWMRVAIIAACLVGLALVAMVGLMIFS